MAVSAATTLIILPTSSPPWPPLVNLHHCTHARTYNNSDDHPHLRDNDHTHSWSMTTIYHLALQTTEVVRAQMLVDTIFACCASK